MTSTELAAFHAGIRHAIGMAQLAALTLELRPDAEQVRQRAAIEALWGLAEGLKASLPSDGGDLGMVSKGKNFPPAGSFKAPARLQHGGRASVENIAMSSATN